MHSKNGNAARTAAQRIDPMASRIDYNAGNAAIRMSLHGNVLCALEGLQRGFERIIAASVKKVGSMLFDQRFGSTGPVHLKCFFSSSFRWILWALKRVLWHRETLNHLPMHSYGTAAYIDPEKGEKSLPHGAAYRY